jgi:hypothetical protein
MPMHWPAAEILNTSTGILLFFDAAGVWLLVRPSDLVNLWTAGRSPASDVDRFFARLAGLSMLWGQVMHWVGQAKNTYAAPIMHWLSVTFLVGAVAFLGYHFVGLFKSKPDRPTRVDQAKRRFLLPESEEESRVRYGAAWKKYRRLRVLFPLAFLGWLPFGAVVGAVFGFFHWNFDVAMIIILAWVPLISIFGWQWAYWQCPRCGYAFKGIYDPFFPKRCHYCDLPVWAESPDQ